MVNQKTLDKIRDTIIDFGDGLCEFETRDIEELLRSYEKLKKKYEAANKIIDKCHSSLSKWG